MNTTFSLFLAKTNPQRAALVFQPLALKIAQHGDQRFVLRGQSHSLARLL
jgi:hypothetical protein